MKKMFKFIGKSLGKLLFNAKAVLFLLILALGAGGASAYFYKQNKDLKTQIANPNQASEQEVADLTGKVGKLMLLPSDEKPTVITVVDKEKLKDQPFFANAQNDDKVLVYTKAKKAIMYRPSTNKLVEVGPVDITPSQTFKVTMLNATSEAAAMDAVASTITSKVNNLVIDSKGNAVGKYTQTTVVDVNGNKSAEATQLAQLIGGVVATMPAAETKPSTDFLVIVAK